ncbi:MAG: prepilin peptidase [Candidatus Baltobacteraceae bacterium]
MIPAAIVFGCLAWFAVLLAARVCRDLPRLADGPPPGSVPLRFLVAASATLGALVVWHHAPIVQVFVMAVVCMALVAAWCSDAQYGIVPDLFTIGPLVLLLAAAVALGEWWLLLSALVPLVPFAIAAALSKGHGMGWGDVKLVALGGLLLGMQVAIVAFALASLAAVLIARKRGLAHGPIAFAPYLVAAIGASLAVIG